MPLPDPVQQFPEGRGRWHGCGQGKCPRGGAAQAVKPLLTTLKVTPIPEGVAAPNFQQSIQDDGTFKPNELVGRSATAMLGELLRWAEALKPLRATAA